MSKYLCVCVHVICSHVCMLYVHMCVCYMFTYVYVGVGGPLSLPSTSFGAKSLPRPGVHVGFVSLQLSCRPTNPRDPLVSLPLGARVTYRIVRDARLYVWVLHSSVLPLFLRQVLTRQPSLASNTHYYCFLFDDT